MMNVKRVPLLIFYLPGLDGLLPTIIRTIRENQTFLMFPSEGFLPVSLLLPFYPCQANDGHNSGKNGKDYERRSPCR